jgi:hypothetical protein
MARLSAIDEGAAAAPEDSDSEGLAQLLGRLDLVLTWLWRVHGVDYYSGRWGPPWALPSREAGGAGP